MPKSICPLFRKCLFLLLFDLHGCPSHLSNFGWLHNRETLVVKPTVVASDIYTTFWNLYRSNRHIPFISLQSSPFNNECVEPSHRNLTTRQTLSAGTISLLSVATWGMYCIAYKYNQYLLQPHVGSEMYFLSS